MKQELKALELDRANKRKEKSKKQTHLFHHHLNSKLEAISRGSGADTHGRVLLLPALNS